MFTPSTASLAAASAPDFWRILELLVGYFEPWVVGLSFFPSSMRSWPWEES